MNKYFIDKGKIVKLKKLGVGESGTVYIGTYAKDVGRSPLPVALRVLNVDVPVSGQSLTSLSKEVKLLERASCECEHICRFFGVSSIQNQPCIVMKLYTKSLADELKTAAGHKLSPALVIRRGVDTCRGLQELHDIGIVMRDLKPPNVLIGGSGTAVLADFGLGKAATNIYKSGCGGHMGTMDYTAPECFKDGNVVTEHTDIWALGCTLLEMCSGSVSPPGTPTTVMMKQAVVDRKCPRVPPDVPEPFARIILQCLQVSPQRRPTAFAVMEALEDALTVCLTPVAAPVAPVSSGTPVEEAFHAAAEGRLRRPPKVFRAPVNTGRAGSECRDKTTCFEAAKKAGTDELVLMIKSAAESDRRICYYPEDRESDFALGLDYKSTALDEGHARAAFYDTSPAPLHRRARAD